MVRGDHNEVAEGDGIGGLNCAFDLVHRRDASRLFRMQQAQSGSAGAAHLAVGMEGGVHRPGFKRIGTEPRGKIGNMLPAGVVKVLARCKDLDRLRS
jgi:hypothetical protein